MLNKLLEFVSKSPMEVVFLFIGLTLLIVSVLGQTQIPKAPIKLACWKRWIFALLGGIMICLSVMAAIPREPASVPVGTVIAWWGELAQIPLGFELCDGTAPHSSGTKLHGNKPNLVNRFPRGTSGDVPDVRKMDGGGLGGEAETKEFKGHTGGTALTSPQMPRHNHGGATGKGGGHAHETFLTMRYGGGAWSDGSMRQGVPEATSIIDKAPFMTSPAPDHNHTIEWDGKGESHDHEIAIPSQSILPSYQQVYYLIRVE